MPNSETALKTDYLGTADLRKLLWKLSVPAIISQLVTLIYNIVDRVYIGHIEDVGGLAITGLGVCTPLTLILSAFAQLICAGGAPIASSALGRKEPEEAEKMAGSSLSMLIIVGAILTVLMHIFDTPLLMLFGASSETLPYAEKYMNVYTFGTVMMLISTGMVSYIIAQGATNISMLSICTGAVLNIILDPLFIWVFKMGISGAALATVISQTVSAVIVLIYLSGKGSAIRLRLKALRPDLKLVGSEIALGLSPFVMQITECALSIAFNRSLLKYGGDVAVGAMTLFTSINSIIFLPINGLCQGAQSITSYNYGAGNFDRVAANIKRLISYCVFFASFMWLLIMTVPSLLLNIFTNDEVILSYALSHIRIFFAMTMMPGIQCSCQFSFLALKNAKVSLFLALLRKVILLIPLIFILPCFIEAKDSAVLMAEPIADTIAATVTGTTFYLTYKNSIFAGKKTV